MFLSRNQTLVEYEETPDEYLLGKLAELADARAKDIRQRTTGRPNSEFTTVLDGITAESKTNPRLSCIWNSIHVVNMLLDLYSLGEHFTLSRKMKVPWLKVMTDHHGGVSRILFICYYN